MFEPFMINAWITASIVAVISGLVGFFIALRGQAFIAHALPNGAFAGAAAAGLININPLFGLGFFSLLGAGTIGLLERKSKRDVATALGFVLLLGMGALFLSLSTEYSQQIFSLLFGEILGVSPSQILPTAALAVITLGILILSYRRLLYTSVLGEELSQKALFRNQNLIFLLMVALVTTMAIPVVGTLLLFTLLVSPAATARLITKTPKTAIAASVILALLMVYSSIAFSYVSNWPVGFFIGMMGVASYTVGQLWRKLFA